MSEPLKFEYLPIESLTPYEKNARKHQKKDIEVIKKSIEQFGMNDPIGIWGKKNIIVEGHGRLLALKELGWTEVPCIRLDHLTDSQRKAYALEHNRSAELSEWDFDLLDEELAKLEDEFDLKELGFEEFLNVDEEEDIVDDEFDEDEFASDEIITQKGDIYILGRHRLMCGDSTNKDDIKTLTGGVLIDLVFTDPPYGMNLDTDYSSMVNHLDFAKEKGFIGGKKYEQGMVDEFNPKLITTIFDEFNYCKEIFLFGADYYSDLIPNKNDGSWFVWDKRANGNDDIQEDYSSDKMYGSCFELCWSKNKHKREIARIKWAGVFGTEQEFDHKRYHPTQKPIGLSSWFINKFSKENDKVLDLFGGSGSTLIAAEQINRNCYMMELDPHYCDVIVKRYIKFVGSAKDCYLIRNGEKQELPNELIEGLLDPFNEM